MSFFFFNFFYKSKIKLKGWFNNANSQANSFFNPGTTDMPGYLDEKPFNQSHLSLFSTTRSDNFGFLNEAAYANLGSSAFDSFKSYLGDNNIYSETSSERSDTPNSCVTNASSLSLNAFPLMSTNAIVPFSYERGVNFGEAQKSSSSSSTSSNASTATLATEVTPVKIKEDLIGQKEFDMDMFDMYKLQGQNQSSVLIPTDTDLFKSDKEKQVKQQQQQAADKKDDAAYCGYVESFPYYYKLNRLYNALAVQKMQTERLRKTGLNNSPVSFSPQSGNSQFINNNNNTNVKSAQMGTSPNGFQYSPGTNPLLGSSILIASTSHSPPTQLGMHHHSKSKNHAKSSKIGFPLSPSNAAISYANHQTKARVSPSLSPANQFNKPQVSQHQNVYGQRGGATSSAHYNISNESSMVLQANSNNLVQQQQQQQQQLMNTFYSQMNSMRAKN